MLGLQERADAGFRDAPENPEASIEPPIDAKECVPSGFAGDSFAGTTIDVAWNVSGNVGVSQDEALHFDLPASGTQRIGDVRTVDTISRTEVVTARLVTGPSQSHTHTGLLLESSPGTSVYRFAVVNNANLPPTSVVMNDPSGGSSFAYDNTQHKFFRLRHDVAEIVFETSADGRVFDERRRVMGTPTLRFHVMLQGITASATTPSRVTWDDVTVGCP